MARQPKAPSPQRPSTQAFSKTSPGEIFWDLLTFDRLLTGPVIHLIYWAGLAIVVLGCFATMGGAVGVAWREKEWVMKFALAIPFIVGGLLILAAAALIWRSFCEFYVAVFRISDDLRALRIAVEAQGVSGVASKAAAGAAMASPRPRAGSEGDEA